MARHSGSTVIFLGSSSFAVPSLAALMELGIKPIVLTKPDKPAGREKKMQPTPVTEAAVKHNLSILQPDRLNDPSFVPMLKEKSPDLILSIAYGDRIPVEILELPRRGCVNLHPSLLPKYRGAAPVQRALMAGETQTGNTLAYVVEEWDAGEILIQEPYPIELHDNAGTLLEKLSHKGAAMIKKALPLLLEKKISAVPQDSSQATYAPKIREEETWIDWNKSAHHILNLIRGLSPQPGAKARLDRTVIKILEGKIFPGNGKPGEVVELASTGPVVAAKENCILLLKVQPENRVTISGKDYVNGYRLQIRQSFQS